MNLDEIFNQKSSSPGFPRSLRSAISSFVLHVMRSLVSTVEVKQKARGVNLVPRAVRGVRRGYLADCPGDEVARGVSNLDETVSYRCILVPICSLQVTAWFTHDMR